MARTALTPVNAPGVFASTKAVAAFTAADVANGNSVACTGRELILAKNANATVAKTITIASSVDPYNRTGDKVISIGAAGEVVIINQHDFTGWIQSDGKLYLNGESTDVSLCVIVLPF